MLIDSETFQSGSMLSSSVAIVGAGPAGIVLALELAEAGHDVVLLESGRLHFSETIQNLGEANDFDLKFHARMSDCTRRQLGGTSTIWGGRCIPYDPVDFDHRRYVPHSSWPITYEDLETYFQRVCDFFFCGTADFNVNNIPGIEQKSIVPGLPDEEVLTSTLERWSLPTNFGKEYFNALKESKKIKLVYGATCTEIESHVSGSRVEKLQTKTLSGKTLHIKAKKYVLSGGALNTTRLLLASSRYHTDGIGNHSGLLGRFYMGHISGGIASVRFTTSPQDTVFGFDKDSEDTYLRRRFSFSQNFLHEKGLTNMVAWLGVPPFGNSSHQNGILSLAYLALSSPVLGKYLTAKAIKDSLTKNARGSYYSHLKNILKDIDKIAVFAPSFTYKRYVAKRKIPALFTYSASNEYPLHYHGEQIPNPSSRVSLSDERDALGMQRLNISLQYTQQDVDSVIRAHQFWDTYLKKYNCGYLNYLTNDPEASIWEQASDGFHQVGTTRMSYHPKDGVVGTDCNVHEFDDLFVASSSVFVTSGQANSTFMIVAFALRLADHLKKLLR